MNQNKENDTPAPVSAAAATPDADVANAPATPTDALAALPPLTDEHGDFAPEWYARYAELQPYAASLSRFRTPEALAKSYAHLERMRGYPDPTDAKRMAAFRAVVGLPEKAEDYALARPEGTPEEAWDDTLAATLAQVAYEYGVPAPAMAALSEKYVGESRRMLEACRAHEQAAIEQADAELQDEWGRNYDDNMRVVGDFLLRLGERAGVDVQPLMESAALRANADFARLMLAAAESLHEAPMHVGQPADSKEEAYRIAHDPMHPLHEAYMRTNHPQHRYANEQYDRAAFGRPL